MIVKEHEGHVICQHSI